MFCENCGQRIDDDSVFCPNCGAKIIPDDNVMPGEEATVLLGHDATVPAQPDREAYRPDYQDQYSNQYTEPYSNQYTDQYDYEYVPPRPQKKSIPVWIPILIAGLIVALAGAGLGVFLATRDDKAVEEQADEKASGKEKDQPSEKETDTEIEDIEETNEQEENEAATEPVQPATSWEDADYVIADSNTRLLSDADIAGWDVRRINYALNEIYARNGRDFKSSELKSFFGKKSWYHATVSPAVFDNNQANYLNSTETKNVEFLVSRGAHNYKPR